MRDEQTRVRLGGLLGTALLPVLAISATGCSIRLDSTPPDAPDGGVETIELGGCVPLGGAATGVSGRLISLVLPGRGLAVIANVTTVEGYTGWFTFGAPQQAAEAAPTVTAPASPDAFGVCLSNAAMLPIHPVIDPTTLNPTTANAPLAAIDDGQGGSDLFFVSNHADDFASDGFGVAHWDTTVGRFVDPVLLWTADRPTFGSGLGLDADTLYVVGGRPGGFLAADMFVARVPLAKAAVSDAYEYTQGGGNWGSDPDSAAAFARGGTSPSLAFYPARARWLLAYATPLANEVTVRSGLGPSGPWSQPVNLGRCTLPAGDPGAFCGDVVLHPLLADVDLGSVGASSGLAADSAASRALSPDDGPPIVLSYTAATFEVPAGVEAGAYSTRLTRVAWPAALP